MEISDFETFEDPCRRDVYRVFVNSTFAKLKSLEKSSKNPCGDNFINILLLIV